MVHAEAPTQRGGARVLRCSGLLAEYSVGQTPAGVWFALGSVRSATNGLHHPAWVIVGTGDSAEEAVAGLQLQLEREARCVSS
jgi:hypothetical protein